ncbi:hypothetical protein Tco_1277437 [Tanacetum coccineum]
MDNQWQQPTTQEITVLVKILLTPLAIKSRENANDFENALKEEMFEDLEYVQSLEKVVDELESEKAEFLNEYDLLLQECVSKDIMCSIICSFESLDEKTELQCLRKPAFVCIAVDMSMETGPHDTQYCMEDPEQAFVEYASSHTDEAGELVSNFMESQDARLSKFEADFKQQQSKMTNKIDTMLKAITDWVARALPSDTPEESQVNEPNVRQEEKGNLGNTNSNPHPQPDPLASIATEQEEDGEVMFIEIIRDYDEPQNESPNESEGTTTEGPAVEYFDTDAPPTLIYHATLGMCMSKKPTLTLTPL